MKSAMRKLLLMIGGIGKGLRVMLGPSDKVSGRDSQGRPRLNGWESVPESHIAAAAFALRNSRRIRGKWALVGLAGPHESEMLLLRNDRERLGSGVANSVVVTPVGEAAGIYRASFDEGFRLAGEGDVAFRVNGKEERAAELFDYDELEILGNRFLVLQLSGLIAKDSGMTEEGRP